MGKLYSQIRSFWDSQPCGTTHVNLPPQSREYFVEFDKFFETFYPYYLPFLNLEAMRGQRVLEIGLGSGFSLHRIAEVAKDTYGLDLSANTIELNRARDRPGRQPYAKRGRLRSSPRPNQDGKVIQSNSQFLGQPAVRHDPRQSSA
ncbi:MAG TPA: hypothetical protein VLN44_13705, partial [Pyrinomonadaceae bacterium]|nr:hypothetical protein [Pyrinomonadaceae bacterium]